MPIQKNNSCRMGGPKKGQWVAIASTAGVCENHNLLPSEILPRSYLQTTFSPGSKEKNTNLLD